MDFSCLLVELNTAHHYAGCQPIPFLFLQVNEVRKGFTFGLLDHGAFNRKLSSPNQDHINNPLLWLINWGMKNTKGWSCHNTTTNSFPQEEQNALGWKINMRNWLKYREYAHDITVAILVSQNNETVTMLVSQTNKPREWILSIKFRVSLVSYSCI